MANNASFNKRAMSKWAKDLQKNMNKELKKRPIQVPVETTPSRTRAPRVQTQSVTNYHGPVVTVEGNNAQIAWGNSAPVSQDQHHSQQIAPGYEKFAKVVTDALAAIRDLPLDDQDRADFESTSQELLEEVVQPEPNDGLLRRGLNGLKGILSPVALGAGQAVTAESQQVAAALIDGLSQSLGV